jgi:hypothetical protein
MELPIGLPALRQAPFTVNPGDSFISKFWFDNKNETEFGIGTYEEMNKDIFLYYPAKKVLTYPWACTYDVDLEVCNASMTSRVLTSDRDLERIFGIVPSMCHVRKEPTTSMGHNHFHGTWCFAVLGACLVVSLLKSFW